MPNDVVEDFINTRVVIERRESGNGEFFGYEEKNSNGITPIIADAWNSRNTSGKEFLKEWLPGDEEDTKIIEWIKSELSLFAALIKRFVDDNLTASDLERILSHFDISVIFRTEIIDGKETLTENPEFRFPREGLWPDGTAGFCLFMLYSSLLGYIVEKRKLGICSASDCNELYVQNTKGRKTLYHSRACQVREYRRRKKASA